MMNDAINELLDGASCSKTLQITLKLKDINFFNLAARYCGEQ